MTGKETNNLKLLSQSHSDRQWSNKVQTQELPSGSKARVHCATHAAFINHWSENDLYVMSRFPGYGGMGD